MLETAQAALPDARPGITFLGVHTSSMEAAHQLVDDLPHWIDGVYLQLSPVNPVATGFVAGSPIDWARAAASPELTLPTPS